MAELDKVLSEINKLPKPTNYSSLYLLAQQAFENGFRGITVNELVVYLSKNLSDELTRSEFIYEEFPDGSTLPDPGRQASIFLGPGTYTTPGGSLELTENFNIVGWNGEDWEKVLEVPIEVVPPENKIPTWEAGTYVQGDQRIHNGQIWSVGVPETDEEPGTGTDWEPVIDAASKEEVKQVKNLLAGELENVELSLSEEGYRSKHTGEIISSNQAMCSELLPIESGRIYRITTSVIGANAAGVCYFDSANNFISSEFYSTSGTTTNYTRELLNIPAGAFYFTISSHTPSSFSFEKENLLKAASEQSVQKIYENLATDLPPIPLTLEMSGYRHRDTGNVTASAAAKSSPLIPIDHDKSYLVTTTVVSDNAAGVCYFDASNNFISSQFHSEWGQTTVYTDEPLTIPEEAAYFAFSSHQPDLFILKEGVILKAASEQSVQKIYENLATDFLPTPLTLETGGYRHRDSGSVSPSAAARCSGLELIDKDWGYKVNISVTGSNAAGVCYFDTGGQFLSSDLYSTGGTTTIYEDELITIPEDAVYFAFSSHVPDDFVLKKEEILKAASEHRVQILTGRVDELEQSEQETKSLIRKQWGVELSVTDSIREQELKFAYIQHLQDGGEEGDWYGVEFLEGGQPDEVTRIGSDMSLHASLPIQSKIRRCITKDRQVQYYLDANDSSLREDGVTPANLNGTDGDLQVELPECFYSVETEGTGASRLVRLKISEHAISGFRFFPKQYVSALEATQNNTDNSMASVVTAIFNTANEEVVLEAENRWVKADTGHSLGVNPVVTITGYTGNSSQYRGGVNNPLYDDATSETDTNYSRNQLGRPIGNLNREEFMNLANNSGDKYFIYQYTAHQMLWLFATVEYATKNIQTPQSSDLTAEGYKTGGLGIGAVRYPDYNGYEAFFEPQGGVPSIPCGVTVGLGNNSGAVYFLQKNVPVSSTGSGASIEYTAWGDVYWHCISYRGVEHPFGHGHKVADGVNIMTTQISGSGSDTLVDVSYFIQNNPFYTHNENNNRGYKPLGTYRYTSHIREVSSIMAQPDAITLPINAEGGSYDRYYCDANEYKQHTPNVYYLALGGRFSSGNFSGFLFHYADYSVIQQTRKPTYVTRLCHR